MASRYMDDTSGLGVEPITQDGHGSGTAQGAGASSGVVTNVPVGEGAVHGVNTSPDRNIIGTTDVPSGFLSLGSSKYNFYGLNRDAFNDPSYAPNRNLINQYLSDLQKRQINQGGVFTANAGALPGDVRANEMALARQFQGQAAGNGPSLAQGQFQQATEAGLRQQLAMAASQRGVNPALAMRQAAEGQAQINQNAAAQSAQIRAQEQLSAQQQLSGLYGQMSGQDLGARQQDIGLSQFNAQQQQQGSFQNLAAGMQQQQHVDELTKQYLAMGLSLDQAQAQAQQQWALASYQGNIQQEAAAHGTALQGSQQQTQAAGSAMSALATLGAAAATMA